MDRVCRAVHLATIEDKDYRRKSCVVFTYLWIQYGYCGSWDIQTFVICLLIYCGSNYGIMKCLTAISDCTF